MGNGPRHDSMAGTGKRKERESCRSRSGRAWWLVVAVAIFCVGSAMIADAQQTRVVGDHLNNPLAAGWPWTFDLSSATDFVAWSKHHLLKVGDTVIFKYTNTTNLFQFSNYNDWYNCNTKEAHGTIMTQKSAYCSTKESVSCGTRIVAMRQPQFFASSVGQQCQQGWKIIIQSSSGKGIEFPPVMWFNCYLQKDNTPNTKFANNVNSTCLHESTTKSVLVGDTHLTEGGKNGEWFYYPYQNYVTWAENETHWLEVDDIAVFRYTARSQVMEVPSLQAWLDCDYTHAITLSPTGSLNAMNALKVRVLSSPRYILGANDGSCTQGQKVILQALSGPGVKLRSSKDSCHGWWECFLLPNGTVASQWPTEYTPQQKLCLGKAGLCQTLAGVPSGPGSANNYEVFQIPGDSPSPVAVPPTMIGEPAHSKDGLSPGAIAGIVIACLVVVAVAAGLAFYFLSDRPRYTPATFRHRRRPSQEEVMALHKVGAVWGWDAVPTQG